MDGGDADGVLEVDEDGEVEGEVVEMDADERDMDLGSALANFARLRQLNSPSRTFLVAIYEGTPHIMRDPHI